MYKDPEALYHKQNMMSTPGTTTQMTTPTAYPTPYKKKDQFDPLTYKGAPTPQQNIDQTPDKLKEQEKIDQVD